jgi:hypothetical protein
MALKDDILLFIAENRGEIKVVKLYGQFGVIESFKTIKQLESDGLVEVNLKNGSIKLKK